MEPGQQAPSLRPDPERFQELLLAQGNACAICRKPFREDQRVCIDHDHACCPVTPGKKGKCCGECVRGLLCVLCNAALGFIETYGELATAYLSRLPRSRP
jgi:Recombination endonuclease VII